MKILNFSKFNESRYESDSIQEFDINVIVLNQNVDDLTLKHRYTDFEEFFKDISGLDIYMEVIEGKPYYDSYEENEKNNTVTLFFNNGGTAEFKIETNTAQVFDHLKEIYE